MVGASLFTAAYHPNLIYRIFGWLGVAFFSLGIFPAVKGLLSREIAVSIDIEGIEDRRLRIGKIPWAEVIDVFV